MSNNEISGAPERIRTSDPQIRSLVLYPAELRAPERQVIAGSSDGRGGWLKGFWSDWQASLASLLGRSLGQVSWAGLP